MLARFGFGGCGFFYCAVVLGGTTPRSMTTTQTQRIAKPTTFQGWLEALSGALGVRHKSDGTKFTHLSDADYWGPIRDDLLQIIHAAHDDELPNEWRYSTVSHIVESLLGYGQPGESPWHVEAYREVSWEIAESGADSYTSQNIAWLAENVGRVAFRDDDITTELLPAEQVGQIGFLALLRQQEEIEWMVHTVLDAIESLTV